MMQNPLFDTDFLLSLDNTANKELFVSLTALNPDGDPVERLEGVVTSGNLNLDGKSAVRRSCSLSLIVLPDSPITDMNWSLKNKFHLQIGVSNKINTDYPAIIWFDQGDFVINNFSKSQGTNGTINISISGQDKMCLLNGNLGGALPDEVDFGKITIIEKDGTETTEKLLLYYIIQNALLEYGNERPDKININDLDDYGLQTLSYSGSDPLYLIYELEDTDNTVGAGGILRSVTINPSVSVWQSGKAISVSKIANYYNFNSLDRSINKKATRVAYSSQTKENCVVVKLVNGQTLGYREIPLTYGGDLILKAGETLTSLMDKIVQNLNNAYEYFYDEYGNFIFQKKQEYIKSLFSSSTGDLSEVSLQNSTYTYKFNDVSKIISISYSPNIKEIRNDFTIHGEKQGIDKKIPIRVRYAIDKKPTHYSTYDGKSFYCVKGYSGKLPLRKNLVYCDWREIIYQMAKDYHANASKQDDFYYVLSQNNEYVKNYKTGYETYYALILSFWRELYYPGNATSELPFGYEEEDYYSTTHKAHPCWNKKVYLDPSSVTFWFDFLDVGEGPLNIISKPKIGARAKVENSKKTTTVFSNDTPEIVFYTGKSPKTKNTTYSYIWIPASTDKLFSPSSAATSLINQANDLIYKHCCAPETISLTTIPIYYLQPNSRIYVEDIGDLIVSKISYSLGHNATMSLSCTRVVDSIY